MKATWFLVAAWIAVAVSVSAQSLEPRLYSNAPTGLNFLLGGYVYSSGGAIADPSLELEDGDLSNDIGENNDLSSRLPEIFKQMVAAMDQRLPQNDAQLPTVNPDYDPAKDVRGPRRKLEK